ncbi:hypothetical protein Y032_0194g1437 [Ancylostoma ceylanicum]|uniref:Uncharacterized protein n=1 Tax=Ancylostoma ceylanicum TaxID=53326 RepID=A0A016SPW5_9BILA|nr:hypothetical protein Y032_0194g1437 [Ancylostoma ceylanicum]
MGNTSRRPSQLFSTRTRSPVYAAEDRDGKAGDSLSPPLSGPQTDSKLHCEETIARDMRTVKGMPANARHRAAHSKDGAESKTRSYLCHVEEMCLQGVMLSKITAGSPLEENSG